MYPLRRVGERGGSKWERVSWDKALDDIAARLTKVVEHYGPEASRWRPASGTPRSRAACAVAS